MWIHGYDDTKPNQRTLEGEQQMTPEVWISIGPGEARNLRSWELEEGLPDMLSSLGDGAGKWTLLLTGDGEMEVMSLLFSEAGYVTNVSH